MAAAGIELRPAGHGFVGRCPFHDDTTPSMSVAGVPDRFTCFGCGAHGDVIDFVQRLHHVTFIEAIHTLTADNPVPHTVRTHRHAGRKRSAGRPPLVPRSRRHRCHRRAGVRHQRARLAAPVRAGPREFRRALPAAPPRDRPTPAAHRTARRTAACRHPGQPLVGYAGHGWTTLVDALRRDGVTADELTVMDLGQRTRDDRLIDTLRDRIIVPVLDADHRIRGFIGRDISGNPRAPKYRNPTHTPTFDKSQHPVPAHPPRPRPRRNRRHRRRRPRRPRHRRGSRSRRPQPAARPLRRQRRHRLSRPGRPHPRPGPRSPLRHRPRRRPGRPRRHHPMAARADHPPRQARLRNRPPPGSGPRHVAAAPPPRRRPGQLRAPRLPVDSEPSPPTCLPASSPASPVAALTAAATPPPATSAASNASPTCAGT